MQNPYFTGFEDMRLRRPASEDFKVNPTVQMSSNFQTAAPASPNSMSPQQGGFGLEQAGALATGIYGLSQSFRDQPLQFDTNMAQMQYGMNDRPTYTGGGLANQVAGTKIQNVTGGEVLGGAAKGAAAGSAFGPIGTAVGAFVGATGSLIGGRRRAYKQRKARRKANDSLIASQGTFNQSQVGFQQRQNSMEDYYQRLNG